MILLLYFVLLCIRIYEPKHYDLSIYNYMIACDCI